MNRVQRLTVASTKERERLQPVEPDKSIARMNAVKGIAAAVVAAATPMLTVFPPDSVGYKVCLAIVGVGAALGIVSQGRQK